MKCVLLAGAAVIAMTGVSFAADMPAAYPVEETFVAPVDVWSGWYAGLQGGYAFGDLDVSGFSAYSSDIEGPLGGLYWGRNWQFDNIVLGLDGSVSLSSIEDQNPAGPLASDPDVTIDAFSASRVRIGYALDNVLIFAAAGFSLAKTEVADGTGDKDAWLKGWTVGAGADVKLVDNWSARLEYMYFSYDTEQRTVSPGNTYQIDVDDMHVIRGGVAYHF